VEGAVLETFERRSVRFFLRFGRFQQLSSGEPQRSIREGKMSRLVLKGLRVRGRVGCKDSERAHPQMLRVDLSIDYDMREAIASDDVASAVDYKEVAAQVREHVGSREWKLIETLTHELANRVRAGNSRIERVEASVTKDVIPDVASVTVVAVSE
jgi:7,8-dihydroneopterin aldolase/epimerase/oxygenase